MKHIIVGTDRPDSRSSGIAKIIRDLYKSMNNEDVDIIDLQKLGLNALDGNQYGEEKKPSAVEAAIQNINQSDGLIIIVPEYNGSYPGILKYFIDHWSYPESFEKRPVCFVGLGGQFGGLRPVEHLQGVFGYRNGFIFPERVFITNVWNVLKDDKIDDENIMTLLKNQTQGFIKFVRALKSESLTP